MHRLATQQSFGNRLSEALLGSFGPAYEKSAEEYKGKQRSAAQEKLLEKEGYDSGLAKLASSNPKIMESILENKMLEDRASRILGESGSSENENNAFEGISGNEPAQKKKSGGLKNATNDQLIALSGLKGYSESSKQQLKHNQEDESRKAKQFQEDRNYHSKTSGPLIEEATNIVKTEPVKKGLINQHRRDIDSGNTTGLGNFLADKTGWEVFRNPEAARSRSAGKQYFMQSLNELAPGARMNVFLEQQLSAGQTQIGREEEANQSVLDLMEFTDDLKAQRAKYLLEEAEKDEAALKYAKNDIARRADKRMAKYAEQREDEMAYTIRKRHEDPIEDDKLVQEMFTGKVPEGTPLTLRAARILMIKNNDDEKKAQAEAKRLGFIFPTEQTYKKIK